MVESKLGGFYSVSNSKGATLTISPSNKMIILRKKEGTLVFKKSQRLISYSLSSDQNGKQYTASLNIDLDTGQKSTNFNIDNIPAQYNAKCFSEPQFKRLNDEIQKLISYSNEIDSSHVSETIDESCKKYLLPQRRLSLDDEVVNHFSGNSNLYKCLSSPKLKESLNKNSGAFEDIFRAVNGYVNDLSIIKGNASPDLKIRCEVHKEDAKYSAKFENGEIVIPVINGKLPSNDCQDFESIFTHEYFHKVGLKDEKNIKAIERFCLEVTNPKILENPKCAAQFSEMTSQSRTLQEVDHKIEKVIKAEQAKLTPVVQKELEKAPLKEVKVSDATWSSLANDPNATIPTAERNSIAATMNSNFESMSGSLNRALGATQTPALAANESPASASGSSSSASDSSSATPSRSPASSYDRAERETYSSANSKTTRNSKATTDSSAPSNDFHTVEEYIVDSKNAKNPRSFNIQSGRSPTSAGVEQDKSLGTTPRQAMAATNSGEVQTGNTRGNADRTRNSEVARSAQGGEFSGVNEGSAATGSALSAQGPAPARAPGKRQPASQNQGGGSGSAAFNGGSSVSSLKEQSLIRGSDYESITSNYRRRDFSNELSQQGVSIYVEKQGMSLGRGDAKIKFIDNGEYLRRAEGN